LKVYDDTVIYILTPARMATGGPNSLHQLCHKLRAFNFNAYIAYVSLSWLTEGPETHPNYIKYANPVANGVIDDERNILIAPESLAHLLQKAPKIRKAIWWLSVDFYYDAIEQVFREEPENTIFDILAPFPCTHFTGSFYAKEHLELFGIFKDCIMPLESYIDPLFTAEAKDTAQKINYVTYNPEKEIIFTEQVIKYCIEKRLKNISFVPLMNLSRDKLASIYKSAKLHIDFGPFPGRERIPREAAANDMCVITGKRGASKYYEDVPIPEKYKFETKPENIPEIAEAIKDCVYDYAQSVNDFLVHKNFVLGLERTFEKNIQDIFKRQDN